MKKENGIVGEIDYFLISRQPKNKTIKQNNNNFNDDTIIFALINYLPKYVLHGNLTYAFHIFGFN